MKKTTLLATCFALLLAFSSPVLADGHYTSGDDMGVEGTGAGVVISKSATIRSTPSYSGKKVTSVPGGSFILASPNVENGWRKVTYGQYILGKPANGLGNRAIYQPAAS